MGGVSHNVWLRGLCAGLSWLYAFFWLIRQRLNHPEEGAQHSEHGEI
jgi:hypothetical protein